MSDSDEDSLRKGYGSDEAQRVDVSIGRAPVLGRLGARST